MARLFCYGTLMFADILKNVLGRVPEQSAGTLVGYERVRHLHSPYPGIFPKALCSVPGVMLNEISSEEIIKLDIYEGDEYLRKVVNVKLTTGTEQTAYTYTIDPRFRSHFNKIEWNPQEFENCELKDYMKQWS